MRTGMLLLAALTIGASCNKKARYVDPDAESRVEGTGIEARDIRAIVAEMTANLLASPAMHTPTPPRLAVLPVENRTRFLIDQDLFTTLITDELIRSAAGRLAIINRDLLEQILAERDRKIRGQVSDDGEVSALAGVDWFVEGELSGLSASTNRAQTDFVVVRFQATNAETGVVAWSNSYQMKKEGSWGVMYQ